MSTPAENKRAIIQTHQWLRSVAGGDLKSPREIRSMAVKLLRHYPFDFEVDELFEESIAEYEKMIDTERV